MIMRCFFVVAFMAMAQPVFAQGQDSHPSERDLAVIATMLPGIYDNNNQTYFEGRTKVDEALRHARRRIDIEATDTSAAKFALRLKQPGEEATMAPLGFSVQLNRDAARGEVTMHLTQDTNAGAEAASCDYVWTREAQQFRAQQRDGCADVFAREIVLGEQQLWWYPARDTAAAQTGPFEFHRARVFECYVDMPGVGGGRDIPYTRYDGITLHDRGDTHWIKTDETPSRDIGITLWQVDWPINNYKGVFTRDSLVIYVSEKTAEGSVEHGYAFVEPDAERVGINLKWLLTTCFMESNAVTRPSM